MKRILTFHNLNRPHLDGDQQDQWCTFSEEDGMVYLLNGNRHELAFLTDVDLDKDIHFATEADCHAQAHTYYSNYGKTYPHLKEWQACITVADAAVVDNDVNESQVMEFI